MREKKKAKILTQSNPKLRKRLATNPLNTIRDKFKKLTKKWDL